MADISLRAAASGDAGFALHVTEACMRTYAEQTWGGWNGRADFDPAFDKIVQLEERDIRLMGSRAIGVIGSSTSSICCRRTKKEASAAACCNA